MRKAMGKAEVCVIVPEKGKSIDVGCKHCRRIISSTEGKFMLGLLVEENGESFRYFLGVDPPIICCGEEKLVIKTFENENEAEIEKTRILQHLEAHRSTSGLKLLALGTKNQNLN